jgi:hypothetical protein
MKHILKYFTIILVFLLVSPAIAEQPKFKVLVSVVPMYNYFNEINSYVKREFRELKDVELVNKGSFDYFVSIVAIPIEQKGSVRGVAFSYVLEHGDIVVHNVWIGGSNQLKEMCSRVVAEFDAKFLESKRK